MLRNWVMTNEALKTKTPPKRRQPGTRRRANDPLARLRQLAQQKIEGLEHGATTGESEAASDAAIGKMTALLRLIERIFTLEQKQKAAERARKPPRLVNDARRLELARRVEAIQRQLELERDHQPVDGQGGQ
jgi:hypothetical protein